MGSRGDEALLTLVVDMWVTIRGFSHASAWVEKYKVEQKKSTQKSKGLRKNYILEHSCMHALCLCTSILVLEQFNKVYVVGSDGLNTSM